MGVFTGRVVKPLLCILLSCWSLAEVRAAVVNAGNVTGVSITTNASNGNLTYSFALSGGGSSEITVYAPDVIRVNYHWAGPFDTAQPMIAKPLNDWSGTTSTLSDLGSTYVIATTQLDVEVVKSPYKVHFKSKGGYYLLQDDFTERDADYNYTGQRGTGSSKLKNRKIFPANQAIFGLGEYGGPMNRRGRELDIWNTATYNWGEFTNPTYMMIPFYYGMQPASGGNPAFVYGVFLNNPCRPLFKFGTETGDRYSFQMGDGRLDYFFFGGSSAHSFPKVIDRFSELTGRPTFLPKWGIGHHLSRFSYDNQNWVEYIANEATATDIPLDAVYLDIDYMDANADGNIGDGQLRQLTFNSKFPNPASMITYCQTRGVKVVPLIEPWLIPGDVLHTEANNNLHFIKDNAGNTVTRGIYVGNVSWFDYSSTPMNQWWARKITNWFHQVPMDGIWNDLTEPEGGDQIPHNALLWVDGQFGTSNTDSRRFWSNERNYFGLRCARQSYNAMLDRAPNKRPFVLSRSGNAGLQRFGVSWSGDTRADWFYHRATIRFGMGAMIAGAAWYGNDVGGFAGTASPELMVRSTEANCLTPFFRNHCDKSAANREPWRFDEPFRSMQRELIKFRYRLMPYFYTLAYESTITGEPMNVPPAFDYYTDANTHGEQSDYNFLVGDYILAAPVYAQGASTRQVYLPYKDGIHWYYWHNNARHEGGQTVTVNAPLGTLPLFVRSGAIIPMGPSMQYANQFQAPWMDINCWPDGQSEFTLFEDDGETWNYQGNGFSKRRMVSNRTAAFWDFTIEAKQGTYNTGTRDFYVYCYNPGTNVVKSVRLNGTALPQLANFNDGPQGWRLADGRIGVKLPDTGTEAAIRVTFADVEDSLQFEWPTYALPENSAFLRAYVTRTGSATGAVSVAFATANGSATAGADYVATNGTLSWAAGDLAAKFIDVVLTDDTIYEGNETFTIQVSSPAGAVLGTPSLTTVTIQENEAVPPALVVTNPANGAVVASGVSNITLQGVANALEWTGLRWSNSLTGASGSAPIAFYWSIADVALAAGTNRITVTATNAGAAVLARDSGTNAAYADGWATNDNGGFGWGPWVIYTSSTDPNRNGRFMADVAAVNIGRPAWGLYANQGNLSEAKRQLTNTLAVGQTVSVSMDNGFLEGGAGTGVALQNSDGVTLWEFFFNGGDNYYSISGGTTDVGWTSGGLDVAFTLTGPTTYRALITPYGGNTRTNTGSLIAAANSDIRLFRAWNFNAGAGSDYDFFFNNLALSGTAGGATGVVVNVVRGGEGQIPQAWRDRYNLTGPNSGDAEDMDGDGVSNLDEYIADSNPTNSASFFGRVGAPATTPATGVVVTVMIQAPTTNSRLYDLSFSADLMGDTWTPLGLNVPGAANGDAVMLNVTNNGAGGHYRARVFLP
ncbi:MAG TPA: glycoside hydrolase family 31 protein [Kiritimatiellia bacterium]|nr:glycoside hydrolase family 31 protein [Kiritimatiellia bacterium]